jgi:prepilin-type N-terminal cleavage/methylation domain-containing protein
MLDAPALVGTASAHLTNTMNKNLSAFTLIELLVVITIIAILASIAFPVFNTVTERANQTKDLSNMRQVGVALKLFAGDHEGSFPVTVDPDRSKPHRG